MADKTFTWVIVIALIVGGYFLYTSMQAAPTTPTNLIPSDLKTTITLNTNDRLASTPTTVNADYYVFKSTGEFYKSGETGSDGTDSFDVQYGGNYKLIAVNESTSTAKKGYLPAEVSFSADTTEGSLKTINMNLYKLGGLSVESIRDPIDLNGNISCAVGSTVSFQVIWKVNESNTAILNPTIVIDRNKTGIDADGIKIATAGFSKVACPNRLSEATNRKLDCFRYENIVTSAQGLQTADLTVKFHDTNSPGCNTQSKLYAYMIDEFLYKEADYVTAGYSAFKTGPSNTADENIGAVDSPTTADGICFGG